MVVYRFEDGAWLAEVRGTNFTTLGRTLTIAKRRARVLIQAYHDIKDLSAAGIDVIDEVRTRSTVNA